MKVKINLNYINKNLEQKFTYADKTGLLSAKQCKTYLKTLQNPIVFYGCRVFTIKSVHNN